MGLVNQDASTLGYLCPIRLDWNNTIVNTSIIVIISNFNPQVEITVHQETQYLITGARVSLQVKKILHFLFNVFFVTSSLPFFSIPLRKITLLPPKSINTSIFIHQQSKQPPEYISLVIGVLLFSRLPLGRQPDSTPYRLSPNFHPLSWMIQRCIFNVNYLASRSFLSALAS